MSDHLTNELTLEEVQSWLAECRSVGIEQDMAKQLLDTMQRETKLREALAKEIICVCQNMAAEPVFIAHHHYCRNNPRNKEHACSE